MTARTPQATIDEIVRLRGEGKSTAEISAGLGISPSAVKKYTPTWRTRKNEVYAEMQRLRALGMTAQQVADELGVGRNTVLKHTKLPDDLRRSSHWQEEPNVRDEWGYPIEESLIGVEPVQHWPDDLPDLELDEFDWTPEELADAVQEARRMLFPITKETS